MLDVTTVLNAAIRQGLITHMQAEEIRPRVMPSMLPLESLSTDIPDGIWNDIFLELYALSGGTSSSPTINEARERIASLKIEELLKVHERLQDNFERRNRPLAAGLFLSQDVSNWQQALWIGIVWLILSQFVLGKGGIPNAMQLSKLQKGLRWEAEFLRRFALAVMISLLIGGKLGSEGAVEARSNLYSGEARGTFYEAMEERIRELTDAEEGWVMEYIPKDDESTCVPCSESSGYYLPGTGPMPGQVCMGKGKCRCRRVPVFLPEIFARLVANKL